MELFNYLLKVSACSALFFAFYLLVLRKLTFFKINRFYLLGSLLMSFIIPSMEFRIEREVVQPVDTYEPVLTQPVELSGSGIQAPISFNTTPVEQEVKQFEWLSLLPYLYGFVVASLLLLAAWRIFRLIQETKYAVKEINGLKLVAKDKGFTNCSFFNYVFIDENSLTETELGVLLAHEEVHAKQYHSVDKLVLIIAKAVLWFNPIVYLYDRALEEAHEYEADETTSQNMGTASYASLLLKLAVSKSSTPLIHNFVKSPIKQRIKMLFNSKSTNMKKLAYLLALPIGLGLIWGFTVDVVEVIPNNIQDKEFTLVIDAGHGGKNKGVVVNGVSEKEIALSMSKKLKALAEAKGIKVVTTRSDDSNVNLSERANAEGSFIISLHVNSQPKGNDRNGVEMFMPSASSDKIKLLRSANMTYSLYQSMKNLQGISISNKPKQAKLYMLETSKLPGVVLELGFLTNKNDYQYLVNQKKQDEMAEAIIDGVLNFKKLSKTDAEMKAMQENVDRLSKPHTAWLKSDQRKSILAKAAKIKTQTLKGKIESLHYFSDRKILDGFILKTDGQRYRVYLTKKQLEQVNLIVGDPISVKANQVEAWQDSDFPVIKTQEILSTNKVIAANVTTYPEPVVLSSTDVSVFGKTSTILITGAVMKIFNGNLEAEYIEMDKKNGLVTAKKARYTRANGYLIKSDLMIFNTKKGTFTVNNPTGYARPTSAAFELLSKLNFTLSDSIKVSRIMDTGIILTGNVKMKIDDYLINARVITANKDSNVITAHFGSLKGGDMDIANAQRIELDVVTKDVLYIQEGKKINNK